MSSQTGTSVRSSDGRKLVLGKLLKSGGAGGVYLLPQAPTQVAKIYHPGDELAGYERKVEAMLELTPDLPDLVDGGRRFVQIAWPQALLRDASGRFLGFLMPAVNVDATSELEVILQERQARAAGLPTGLGAKVTLAANLAAVIAALHAQHHYLVDLKPVNLRFYRDTLYMAMLDCDGFSIQGKGERFLAPQFTPDYLAPEFHARGVTASGEQAQDRFALAVVVFQLMNFGIHPFSGKPSSDRVPTDIPGRIAGRWYAYGLKPNAAIAPSPVSAHQAMPTELRQLFDRAFDKAGASRPSAAEWSELLKAFAQRSSQRLVVCGRDPTHQHFAGQACGACARLALLTATAKQAAARGPRVPPPRKVPQWALPTPPPLPRGRATARSGPGFRTAPLPPSSLFPTPAPAPVGWIAQLVYIFWTRSSLRSKINIVTALFFMAFLSIRWLAGVSYNAHEDGRISEQRTAAYEQPSAAAETRVSPSSTQMPTPIDTYYAALEIDAAAAAMTSESFVLVSTSMNRLRADVDKHPAPGVDTDSVYRALLQQYSRDGQMSLPNRREEFRQALLNLLATDPAADAVAYQLGWWCLIDGDAASAKKYFTQAVWANPNLPEAWFGLAVSTPAQDRQLGVMAVAESLFSDPAHAQVVHDAFARNTFAALAIDPQEFAVTQARAQRLARLFRSEVVPAKLR